MSDWVNEMADNIFDDLDPGDVVPVMEPREVYDQAIVGMLLEEGGQVVYDRPRVIELLEEHMGMSSEEALEYHYFNQEAMHLWCFLDRPE